jgi:hypothetical protein
MGVVAAYSQYFYHAAEDLRHWRVVPAQSSVNGCDVFTLLRAVSSPAEGAGLDVSPCGHGLLGEFGWVVTKDVRQLHAQQLGSSDSSLR